MAKDQRNPRDYFLIDTRSQATSWLGQSKNPGRGYKYVDLTANEEYRTMVELQQKGKLKEAMSESAHPIHLRSRAANFHDISHLTPETIKYQTDVDEKGNSTGLIWIPKENKEDAKAIMRNLRALDKDVDWSPLGLTMTEEELKLDKAPKNSPVPQPVLKKDAQFRS